MWRGFLVRLSGSHRGTQGPREVQTAWRAVAVMQRHLPGHRWWGSGSPRTGCQSRGELCSGTPRDPPSIHVCVWSGWLLVSVYGWVSHILTKTVLKVQPVN